MEATVIVAKCEQTKDNFAIRAEKKSGNWLFTWAFKLSSTQIKREGYDKTTISGSIFMDHEYPGCPHCRSNSFFQCGKCKKISCYDGNKSVVECHFCGNKASLTIVDSFDNIEGGAF